MEGGEGDWCRDWGWTRSRCYHDTVHQGERGLGKGLDGEKGLTAVAPPEGLTAQRLL